MKYLFKFVSLIVLCILYLMYQLCYFVWHLKVSSYTISDFYKKLIDIVVIISDYDDKDSYL